MSSPEFTKLIQKAEQGDPIAQFQIGKLYETGSEHVVQDVQLAFQWYLKAAEHGQRDAQNSVGDAYYHGRGTEQNQQKAVEWFTKSANNGSACGQYSLGWLYNTGRGVNRDVLKARELWTNAASQGHDEARADLETMVSK
ncbi:hypothetical protein DFQ27_005762 [Actinomortierella ambigua]|uniref:Sel1 repeat family protein n=1 Tax=Actinomortierella ambigua TaxID=1343610 RepID=A0A9P6U2H7_9FUNG|nr:hypothetical protein DFQ27_005762 [Actinomortierella ambigua]